LVPLVTAGFDHATAIGAVQAWVSALAYTLQIYFDFSGYTDMALGAALLFNIRLPINFDSPYRSLSLREFWHRWHMTLSRFLREYVYVPLGGNRAREPRVLGNLLVTFLLGGLWHGAAWTFVCWGALHGLGLCVQRVWNHSGRRLPAWVAWPMTFLFVVVTWVFFRAHSLDDAFAIVRAMAGRSTATASTGGVREVLQGLWTAHEAAALSMLAGLAVVFTRRNSNVLVREIAPSWFLAAATAGALTLAVLQLGRVAPFLYFNF
jgi:D-alanyl-lipoteichoic acid acyltransferase DltB (MBOAT superfamily)